MARQARGPVLASADFRVRVRGARRGWSMEPIAIDDVTVGLYVSTGTIETTEQQI